MIRKAEMTDAKALCAVAISAFIEDEKYRPKREVAKAPPGHDDVWIHKQWIAEKYYLKYVLGTDIVAGCVARLDDDCGEIEGLFVDANYMNRGIGREMVEHLLQERSDINIWELETPDYAVRNHAFY